MIRDANIDNSFDPERLFKLADGRTGLSPSSRWGFSKVFAALVFVRCRAEAHVAKAGHPAFAACASNEAGEIAGQGGVAARPVQGLVLLPHCLGLLPHCVGLVAQYPVALVLGLPAAVFGLPAIYRALPRIYSALHLLKPVFVRLANTILASVPVSESVSAGHYRQYGHPY